MSTTLDPLSSTRPRPVQPLLDDQHQNGDHSQPSTTLRRTAEQLVAPTLPTTVRNPSGFPTTLNSANPTFVVLKATCLQTALGHPMAFVRALMQMGYEPLPAYRGTNLFGKETIYYPNVFRYLRFVYNSDGLTGLYRGFGCSLMAKVVCWYTTTKVDELLGPVDKQQNEQLTWHKCLQKTLREVRCQSWGILVSHPFQVMAVRCMAQFVGKETSYSSINVFQNIREIYQHQGVGGFFVGLIPRWLLEVFTIVISNFLIHLLKTRIQTQQEMAPLFEYLAAFVAQSITYPLSVVTTVATVNRSGLRAGQLTPVFANWQEAYRYLSKNDQLKRGSSLINRVAVTSGAQKLPTPVLIPSTIPNVP